MAIGTPTSLGGNFNSGGNTITITTTAAIVAGNLVVVAVATGSSGSRRTVSSISDGTNNYSQAFFLHPSSAGDDLELWYVANATAVGSGATITVNLSGTTTFHSAAAAAQVSGIVTASPVDAAINNTLDQSGTGHNNPSLTSGVPTTNSTIIFGLIAYGIASGTLNLTDHSPFSTAIVQTNPATTSDNLNVALAYTISTSKASVTYAPTFNTSPDYDYAIVTGFIGTPITALSLTDSAPSIALPLFIQKSIFLKVDLNDSAPFIGTSLVHPGNPLSTQNLILTAVVISAPVCNQTDTFTTSSINVGVVSLPALIMLSNLQLGGDLLNYGFSAFASANKIAVCWSVPLTYADAISFSIGAYNFGTGNACNASQVSDDGVSIVSRQILNAPILTTSTPVCWAILDDANSRLLATGPMTGAYPAIAGQTFSLSALAFDLPRY